MSTCEHKPALNGYPNQCPYCPTIPGVATMDKIIAVGFGTAVCVKDGDLIFDGERWEGNGFATFQTAEDAALADTNHDWRVILHGPLHGETYQRQGPGKWVLIEKNNGFA